MLQSEREKRTNIDGTDPALSLDLMLSSNRTDPARCCYSISWLDANNDK